MFEKALAEKLEKIFKIKKVTYDQPADAKEQECIFVTVQQPRVRVSGKVARARVSGTITIHANSEKMPFGYMQKSYEECDPALKRDIAFFNMESNEKVFRNLVQRSAEFTYFFSSQYDPNQGNISSVTISVEETTP